MKTNRACVNSVRNPLLLVHQVPGVSLQPPPAGTPRICICCGEAMVERGNDMSRNPNVCASCSSLADGMDEHPERPAGGDDWQSGISVPIQFSPDPARRFR